jgi:hypothetical protein
MDTSVKKYIVLYSRQLYEENVGRVGQGKPLKNKTYIKLRYEVVHRESLAKRTVSTEALMKERKHALFEDLNKFG